MAERILSTEVSCLQKLPVERREHSRYLMSLEIEIKEVGSNFPSRGTTTDVSLGGCYVATIFPLAVGAQISFKMRVGDESIAGSGTVQTCHPNVGMGLKFVDLTDQDRRRLEEHIRASVAISSEAPHETYLQ